MSLLGEGLTTKPCWTMGSPWEQQSTRWHDEPCEWTFIINDAPTPMYAGYCWNNLVQAVHQNQAPEWNLKALLQIFWIIVACSRPRLYVNFDFVLYDWTCLIIFDAYLQFSIVWSIYILMQSERVLCGLLFRLFLVLRWMMTNLLCGILMETILPHNL